MPRVVGGGLIPATLCAPERKRGRTKKGSELFLPLAVGAWIGAPKNSSDPFF